MKRIAVGVMVAIGALVVGAFGTGATVSAYPPNPPVIETSDSTPAPGEEVTVSALCVVPETVVFTFNGESKSATCQPAVAGAGQNGFAASVQFNGIATTTFTAPTQTGDFTVTAQLLTTGITLTSVITVTIPPTDTTIPKVGGGGAAGEIVQIGGGLLLVGASMSAVAGRRRQAAGRQLVDTTA
ncbi:MAG: hypothetical protein RLZZ01_332 [Actinomycetota bacterium]